MYSLTEQKEQTRNSYTALCQYFLGLPSPTHTITQCLSRALPLFCSFLN